MPELNSHAAVVACDLDGTLLSINSYKHWLIFIALASVVTLKPTFFVLFFSLHRQRRRGHLSRWEMKRALIDYVSCRPLLTQLSEGIFNRYLRRFVRSEVVTLLVRLQQEKGAVIYLVTAAWEGYCKGFRGHYGMVDILATRTGNGNENIGSEKLEAMLPFLRRCPPAHLTVLTDHHDDLVLAEAANTVYLVAPSHETLEKFELARVSFIRIAG